MDPNATLAELLALVAELQRLADEPDDPPTDDARIDGYLQSAARLAELLAGLDTWIRRGGFLPTAWDPAERTDRGMTWPEGVPVPRVLTPAQVRLRRQAIRLNAAAIRAEATGAYDADTWEDIADQADTIALHARVLADQVMTRPAVPAGLVRKPGVEVGCGRADCADCYTSKGGK